MYYDYNMGDLEKIFSFLNLELSIDGLQFFLNVKKCYESNLELFENFFEDYLVLQSIENSGSLYNDFVNYFSSMREIQSENSLLEQFARYAKYYLMLNFEYIKNQDFKHWISIINSYNGRVAYPFLMELLDDFENQRIDQEGLNEMALMIINVLKNTTLEGAELRKEFAGLSLNINRMLGKKAG